MSKAAPWEDDPVTDARAAPWERDAEVAPRGARVKLPRLPNGQIDQNSPQFKAAKAASEAELTREGGALDPTVGMNWGEKALVNVGAGMSGVIDAAKQRLGTSGAPSDEDVRETRRRDEQLAERTGGGKVLQIAGQALPLVAAGLVPGMQGIAGGAALGALGGALQTTTDDESAWENAAWGAGIGGALPAAGKVLKAARGRVGGAGRKAAGEALASELAPEAAPAGGRIARATESVKDWARLRNPESGGFNTSGASKSERQRVAEELAAQLRGVKPTDIAGVRVPVSSAAAIENDALTRVQQGAQLNRGHNWQPWKRTQAEAITDALRGSTASADDLARLQELRSEAWESGMADAMQHANDPFEFGAQAAKYRNKLAEHRASPLAQRQGVRPLLSDAEAAIEAAGDTYSPAHMLEYRTGLNQGFSSPAGRLTAKDAGLTAVKGDIDEALNAVTGGRVANVIRQFREASPAVNAAEAAGNVRGAFLDDAGRPMTRATHGQNPEITEAKLREVIRKQTNKRFGQQLDADTSRNLNTLLDVIRKNKNVEQANRFIAPEGSATMANKAAMEAEQGTGRFIKGALEMKLGPFGKAITTGWDILANGTQAQREAIMDRALQDPQLLAELLESHAKSLGPTRAKDAVLTALRQGAATRATE
jgi:hypothetical protein